MDMMSLRRRVMVNQNKLMTATGNPITFNTPLTKPLKECVVRFTPQQEGSGTPSPDNVRNISGRNSVKLWQSGKNLLNPNDANWGQYTINPTGGHVEETDRICSGYIPCNEGDTYTFSGSVMGSLSYVMSFVGIAGFDKDKVYVSRSMANHVSAISYTVPNGVKYIRVFEEAPKYPNITMAIWCNTLERQLEIGSTATEYEPYTGNEITFTFPSTVGDNGVVYGGYVDLVNGEVVAEWYKVPTSAFVKYRQNNGYIAYRYEAPDYASGIPWLCNLIGEYGSFSTSNMTKNIIQSSRVGGKIYLALDETVDINTLQIVFPLEEPIHYPIPSRILTTLRGNNVMWSDANGDLTVKYWTR